MISFIRGKKIHIDPAKIIIEVNGIGYDINISLRTYSKLKDESEVFVYTHLNVKEDSHTLYGFNSESERNTFLSLLSINGVGPSTAIMILSSLSANELKKAIISSDTNKIKSVNYNIDTYKKKIYIYGISQDKNERDEVIKEARQILDVEDVITSIFLVEDLRVVKK